MRKIKGKLPKDVKEAIAVLCKATIDWMEALAAKAGFDSGPELDVYTLPSPRYDKAGTIYREAYTEFAELLDANGSLLRELHDKECKDCSWNGCLGILTFKKRKRQ